MNFARTLILGSLISLTVNSYAADWDQPIRWRRVHMSEAASSAYSKVRQATHMIIKRALETSVPNSIMRDEFLKMMESGAQQKIALEFSAAPGNVRSVYAEELTNGLSVATKKRIGNIFANADLVSRTIGKELSRLPDSFVAAGKHSYYLPGRGEVTPASREISRIAAIHTEAVMDELVRKGGIPFWSNVVKKIYPLALKRELSEVASLLRAGAIPKTRATLGLGVAALAALGIVGLSEDASAAEAGTENPAAYTGFTQKTHDGSPFGELGIQRALRAH